MSYLSQKAQQLTPYEAGYQPPDQGWVKLNTNENPYPPSPDVMKALEESGVARLRLYPDSDSSALRSAIADCAGVGTENIFCGNGSDEVLALAFQAFFSGKNDVLTPDISYGFYPVWGKMYDVGLRFLPLDEAFTIEVAAYRNSAGVVIANPNAPTGIALQIEEIEAIVRSNPQGVVIIDEAYVDFSSCGSAVDLIGKYENLLVVRTFSKSHSLAGARVGYAVGGAELIGALQKVKNAFNSYPLDMLSQVCAAAAIKDVAYYSDKRDIIVETRKLVESELSCAPSQANFIFWKTQDGKAMYEHLYANKVLVRHWDKPRISNYLRVTIGTREEMEVFLQCVKKY